MGLEAGINLLETIFFRTSMFSQFWIIQLTIIVTTLAIITRKVEDWKELALPVMIGWKYFGMDMYIGFYIIASIIFVVSALSINTISSAIGVIEESFRERSEAGGLKGMRSNKKLRTEKRRMNIKSEMEGIKINKEIMKEYGTLDRQTISDINRKRKMDKKFIKEAKERQKREEIQRLKTDEIIKKRWKEGLKDEIYLSPEETGDWMVPKKKRMKDKNKDFY